MNSEFDEVYEYDQAVIAELTGLVAFLCKQLNDLETLRETTFKLSNKACKQAIIDKWPTIQGTRRQRKLAAIGKLPWTTIGIDNAISHLMITVRNHEMRKRADSTEDMAAG